MAKAKTKKRVSRKQQKLLALQIQEYIERYHPEKGLRSRNQSLRQICIGARRSTDRAEVVVLASCCPSGFKLQPGGFRHTSISGERFSLFQIRPGVYKNAGNPASGNYPNRKRRCATEASIRGFGKWTETTSTQSTISGNIRLLIAGADPPPMTESSSTTASTAASITKAARGSHRSRNAIPRAARPKQSLTGGSSRSVHSALDHDFLSLSCERGWDCASDRKPYSRTDAGRGSEIPAEHAGILLKQKTVTDRCFLLVGAKRQTILPLFRLPLASAVCRGFSSLARSRVRQKRKEVIMSDARKNRPSRPFRRSQVVSPVPSERRFGKTKFTRKNFDIYVSDIETGDETLAMTVYAPTQREAIQIARKRLQSSPVLRKITHAAFTAVEIEQ
jgi:hypothetical protein